MKWIHSTLLILACLALSSLPAHAWQAMGVHAKVVDGFVFLADNSGSMMMTYAATNVKKIDMAKQAMTRLNAKMPELGYQGALCLFSPNKAVVAPSAWNRAEWAAAIRGVNNNAAIYGRMTPMGSSFGGVSSMLGSLPSKVAVVLFSDGVENLGGKPMAALQALYAAHPGMVLHIVSLADTAAGKATLKSLAALNSKSLMVDAYDVVHSEEDALNFVRTAFYNETIPSQEVVSLREVLFQVGKYNIMPKYAKQLDELAKIMVTRPELKIFIEGFADPSGRMAANQTLSQNRANAVKSYLMSRGVKDVNLVVKGRGQTDRFPTYLLDRRVDIMIIAQ